MRQRDTKDYGRIIEKLRSMSDLGLCQIADQDFDGPWQRAADFLLRHERGYVGSVRTWLRQLQEAPMSRHNGGPALAA